MVCRRLAIRAALFTLACVAALAGGRGRLAAQGAVLSLQVGESTDGMAVVLQWGVGPAALYSDAFTVLRRFAIDPTGTRQSIAQLGNAARGYTDYSVSAGGIWCYQVQSISGGRASFASNENCAGFLPGSPGTAKPYFNAGCTLFYQTLPAGTPMRQVAARFQPRDAVASLWRFDASAGQQLSGYFPDAAAPVDFGTLQFTQEFQYVCLFYIASFG